MGWTRAPGSGPATEVTVAPAPNTEPEGAQTVGARILDQSRDAARSTCPGIPVSASIGTTAVRATDDPVEVIRRVDEQLYAAKRAGGDRVFTG